MRSSPEATTGRLLALRDISACLYTFGWESRHRAPGEHWLPILLQGYLESGDSGIRAGHVKVLGPTSLPHG